VVVDDPPDVGEPADWLPDFGVLVDGVGLGPLADPTPPAGTGVLVGATVAVGGTAVAVGGTGVLVGGTAVAVGSIAVAVAGTGVLVGGIAVAVGTAVFTTTTGTTGVVFGFPCPPTFTVVVWDCPVKGLVMKAVFKIGPEPDPTWTRM
jgi:hypothetical protein